MTARGRARASPAVLAAAALAVGFGAAHAIPGRAALADWASSGRPPDLSRVDGALVSAAREFGLDADLLRGLVAAESGGDPRARSRAGAVGLTQLVPQTAAEQARALRLDPSRIDLADPATNARLGARYLARLLEQFGQEPAFAIAAYNAGPESVKRWRLRAPDVGALEVVRREGFEETRRHVDRTLRFRDAYRAR